MKAKKIYTLLLCLLGVTPMLATAQDTTGVTPVQSIFHQVGQSTGIISNNFGSLNGQLRSNGFNTMPRGLESSGYNVTSSFGKYVLLAEIASVKSFKDQQQPGELVSSFSGNYTDLSVGLLVVQKEKFRLYPFVGGNFATTYFKIEDHSELPTNLTAIWSTPRRESTIKSQNFALHVGVQADRLFYVNNQEWDCPQNTRYFALGLRAGYYLSTARLGTLTFNGQALEDKPNLGLNGPYLKLTVMVGTKMRKLNWK